MKIFSAEISGNKKTRINFSISYEEIEILAGLISRALQVLPETSDNTSQYQMMRNMNKAMSVYLGKSKPRTPKSSEFQCPKCPRKLRGEKAVQNHLRDVHGGESEKT